MKKLLKNKENLVFKKIKSIYTWPQQKKRGHVRSLPTAPDYSIHDGRTGPEINPLGD